MPSIVHYWCRHRRRPVSATDTTRAPVRSLCFAWPSYGSLPQRAWRIVTHTCIPHPASASFGACTVLTMSLTDVPDGPVWRQLSANVAKAIAQVRRTRTCRVGVVVLSPCCNIRVFLPTQHWRETEVAQIAAFSANAISVVELDSRSNDKTVFGAHGWCAAVHRMRRWFAVVMPALSCL